MTGNEYQKLAMRTANPKCLCLSNAGLGLTGEAGEIADEIKKYLHHEHPLNREKLLKELGDLAWYIALCCEVLHESFDHVLEMNIDKLKARYPDGFDPQRSMHRKEGDV